MIDINIEEGISYETNEDIKILVAQIQMILLTNQGDLISDCTFGVNLDNWVHELNLNNSDLQKEIYKQIYEYCSLAKYYPVDVNVYFIDDGNSDNAIIDIVVNYDTRIGIVV